jgi:hypothetical protein
MDRIEKTARILAVGITAIAFYKALRELFKEEKPKKLKKKSK